MEPHPLTTFVADLVRERGTPRVLDVEHSIQVYRPTLTGSQSVASYYIRPPDETSVEDLIARFEKVPGFEQMNLTLTSILGLDTYHQPLISVDDFAKKYFGDNRHRIIRVVGKTDQAIAAMASFIEALKPPFDAGSFPHHRDFLLSGRQEPQPGRLTQVKLLFKPADANLLMKVEREIRLHLDEINLGREITTSRHITRGQPPELILTSFHEAPTAQSFMHGLADSLPRATSEEISTATEASHRSAAHPGPEAPALRASFAQAVTTTLAPAELKKRVIEGLADILKTTGFADGLAIQVVQAGTAIEVTFPRTAGSLWLSTSFDERKHIKAVSNACTAVKADPLLREGWSAHYRFDRKTGKLLIRTVDAGAAPAGDMKTISGSG